MDKKTHAATVLGLRSTTVRPSDKTAYQAKLKAKDIMGMAKDLCVANGMYPEEFLITIISPLEFVCGCCLHEVSR